MSSFDLASIVVPDPHVSREAVLQLSRAVLEDGAALISRASETTWASNAVPEASMRDLERRRKALDRGIEPREVVGPDLFQWYFKLLDDARRNDRGQVRQTLGAGPGSDNWTLWQATSVAVIPGTRMSLDQGGPRPRRAADTFACKYSELYGEPVSILPIPPALFEHGQDGRVLATKLAEAARQIAFWYPEARTSLEELTTAVTFLQGPYLVGASDLACFGTTFLKARLSWSVLCFADHLVHEAAHQALHAAAEVLPPLRNPDTRKAPSPIRPDPRPLNGTLHATVVFSWLVELFRRVMNQVLDPAARDECTARLHRHLLGYLEGCQALEEHAEWTEAGRCLWSALDSRRRQLLAELGDPDSAWYERIPEDYEPPSSLQRQRTKR